MTTTNARTSRTATAARAAIACALASALALGAATVPALAATPGGPDAPVTDFEAPRPAGTLSEGEAVYIGRTSLGIAPEDVFDLDCELVTYRGRLCWEVEVECFGSAVEHCALVDAYDGTVLATWDE